jgi:hypothetical protein
VACLRTSVWMSLSTPAVTMATTFTRRKIGISDFINDYNLSRLGHGRLINDSNNDLSYSRLILVI